MRLLTKEWWATHAMDIGNFIGIGLMALGVGMNYSVTGAVAVFALGLPILEIKRHMREQIEVNQLTLLAIQALQLGLRLQHSTDRQTAEMLVDVRDLLKRISEEGITRE